MEIVSIRHSWPERAYFNLQRPKGAKEYVLLHFLTPVELSFGGECHSVSQGGLIVFAPGVGHSFINREPLLHDWMHLTGDVEGELSRFGLEVNRVHQMHRSEEVTRRMARLETEFFARGAYWQTCQQALLDEMWIAIARQLQGRTQRPVAMETERLLRALRSEMILHPELPWNNDLMAQRVNLSVSRLYPLYKRLFSLSPGRDLILMRVEKAKRMLLQGMGVAQTAEELGYASTYHFIRQFRQETGCTPGKWPESGQA